MYIRYAELYLAMYKCTIICIELELQLADVYIAIYIITTVHGKQSSGDKMLLQIITP